MIKIKFIFEQSNGNIITNDKKFDEEFIDKAETDDELKDRIGCVVFFDSIPMLQDYQLFTNKLWCEYLQFLYGGSFDGSKLLKKVTTELIV